MRLTTKSRYSVTAMLDLALYSDQDPVSLLDISNRQRISLSYLEQLVAKLRKAIFGIQCEGPGGGYLLSRSRSEIFVAQIVDAVDESVDAMGCKGKIDCQEGNTCLTHYLWSDLSTQIHDFLSQISLEQLVLRNDVRKVVERQSKENNQSCIENNKISIALVS